MFATVLRIALRDLRSRTGRTLLTIVGIAIAVSAFVALDSVVRGFDRALVNNVATGGVHINIVEKDSIDYISSIVPEKLVEQVRMAPEVDVAAALLIRLTPVRTSATVPVIGWADDAFMWSNVSMTAGRRPQAAEPLETAVGADLARKLNIKLGDRIDLFGVSAPVVGIATTPSQINRGAIFTRLPDLQALSFRPAQATSVNLRLKPSALSDIPAAVRSVAALVPAFTTIDSETLSRDNILLVISHTVSRSVSIIALLLTFFGVLGNLLTSVRERRHEYAILRAIGWPFQRIGLLILCQALAMCLAGIALGIGLGYGAARIVAMLPQMSGYIAPELGWPVLLWAFGTTLMTGLISLIFPLWMITRIDPAATLRSP